MKKSEHSFINTGRLQHIMLHILKMKLQGKTQPFFKQHPYAAF